jgi:hypothetical protein
MEKSLDGLRSSLEEETDSAAQAKATLMLA